MRKLILKMSMTIDGFVGGPNGELEWLFKSQSDDGAAWTVKMISQAGAHLMGRKTFHDMAAYWPASTEPFAPQMNEIPKIVFSRKGFKPSEKGEVTAAVKDALRARKGGSSGAAASLPENARTWKEAQVLTGDLAGEIAKLKKQSGKDLIAHGGAGFAQSLVATGLIDEYWLLTHPVALGRGLPIFSGLSKPIDMRLLDSIAFGGGAVAHVYQAAVNGAR
jgi:dihydrofolate reductase